MPKAAFTPDAKQQALELLRQGESVATVQFITGIKPRSLQRWRKALHEKDDIGLSQKSFACDSAVTTKADDSPAEPNNNATPADEPDAKDTVKNPDDHADFTFIREKLMTYARAMAANLAPDDPDINRRTLALTRILDRIQWLDQILPDRIPERVIRFEHYYDGEVQEHPPWHGASEGFDRSLSHLNFGFDEHDFGDSDL